jgi:hypothetical protein
MDKEQFLILGFQDGLEKIAEEHGGVSGKALGAGAVLGAGGLMADLYRQKTTKGSVMRKEFAKLLRQARRDPALRGRAGTRLVRDAFNKGVKGGYGRAAALGGLTGAGLVAAGSRLMS